MKNLIFCWKLIPTASNYQVVETIPDLKTATLDDLSRHLPEGAYSTLRTYDHSRVIRIDEHIARLVDSAARSNHPVELKPGHLKAVLSSILSSNPFPDARIRITLDLTIDPGCLYVVLEELHTPAEDAYANGVCVITRHLHRENALAKLTTFIQTAAEIRSQMPTGIHETLMVGDDERILEGLSSNFFGVKNGVLLTAERGILDGITRRIVLEIARQAGYPIRLEGISINEIVNLQECFITSASRAVLPVVKINDQVIADGRPGRITRQLMTGFQEWIQREAVEI